MQRRSQSVSVIVTLNKNHLDFFQGYCLPSIEANEPKEILVMDEDLPESVRRNQGAERATGEYLLFCDDTMILKANCLETYASYLEVKPQYSFAYSNFIRINLTREVTPSMTNRFFLSIPWDPLMLREINYIDRTSLIRKSDFLGFDESLPKHEDWELWLRMAKEGKKGLHLTHTLYFSCITHFEEDQTIDELALRLIDEKHPRVLWPFRNVPRN